MGIDSVNRPQDSNPALLSEPGTTQTLPANSSSRPSDRVHGFRRKTKHSQKVIIRWRPEKPGASRETWEQVFEPPSMILVGRLPNTDICLSDDTVSRLHAKIYVHDNLVEIADAKSSNGTYLEGRPIDRQVWKPGQKAKIGGFIFEFECRQKTVPSAQSANGAPALRPDLAPINLQVTVTKNNILECASEVLTVGLSDPLFNSSAVRMLNQRSGKIISTLQKSGRLDLRPGATTLVPLSRYEMTYDYMLLIGLGDLKAPFFQMERGGFELRLGSRVRSFGYYAYEYILQFGLDSMATVLSLSKKSDDPSELTGELIHGCLLAGLRAKDWPDAPFFPPITLCELDDQRYEQIVSALKQEAEMLKQANYRAANLGPSAYNRKIALNLILEEEANQSSATAPDTIVSPEILEPVKLDIRALGQRAADDALEFELCCLRPAGYAFAETQRSSISCEVLQTQIREIYNRAFASDYRSGLTAALFERIIPQSIRQALEEETRQRPLCLTIDADVAMIPWEALALGHLPSMKRGMSRILRASGPGGIKPILTDLQLPINLLLVVNPTCDLDEAEREGEQIMDIAARHPNQFNLNVLKGNEASKVQLIRSLIGKQPHIMHFCGHCIFSREEPKKSGLICADGEVFTGIDMASVSPMPSILVFNACLSGRLQDASSSSGLSANAEAATPVTSIAEAAIYGGVSSLVGTLWQVGDKEAGIFAQAFYDALLDHKTLGEAVAFGRHQIHTIFPESFDWANYLLYGDESLYLRPADLA